jgi:hypothetical protein
LPPAPVHPSVSPLLPTATWAAGTLAWREQARQPLYQVILSCPPTPRASPRNRFLWEPHFNNLQSRLPSNHPFLCKWDLPGPTLEKFVYPQCFVNSLIHFLLFTVPPTLPVVNNPLLQHSMGCKIEATDRPRERTKIPGQWPSLWTRHPGFKVFLFITRTCSVERKCQSCHGNISLARLIEPSLLVFHECIQVSVYKWVRHDLISDTHACDFFES